MAGKYLILSEDAPEVIDKATVKTKVVLKEVLGRELTVDEEKKVERKVIKDDPWLKNKFYQKGADNGKKV